MTSTTVVDSNTLLTSQVVFIHKAKYYDSQKLQVWKKNDMVQVLEKIGAIVLDDFDETVTTILIPDSIPKEVERFKKLYKQKKPFLRLLQWHKALQIDNDSGYTNSIYHQMYRAQVKKENKKTKNKKSIRNPYWNDRNMNAQNWAEDDDIIQEFAKLTKYSGTSTDNSKGATRKKTAMKRSPKKSMATQKISSQGRKKTKTSSSRGRKQTKTSSRGRKKNKTASRGRKKTKTSEKTKTSSGGRKKTKNSKTKRKPTPQILYWAELTKEYKNTHPRFKVRNKDGSYGISKKNGGTKAYKAINRMYRKRYPKE
jgi:cobalamin biosynthesis Mg chelatase CobN